MKLPIRIGMTTCRHGENGQHAHKCKPHD
jgi:hypothetical protein